MIVIVAEPIQQVGLGEKVADALRSLIIQGSLAPGERLVEGVLAEQFGVSRGPVREALTELVSEGLVDQSRRGAFVIGITEVDIRELYSLRETIEQFAVSLLMDSETPVDWRQLDAQVERMQRAADLGDDKAFSRADVLFHSLVYETSGHRRLLDVWRGYEKTFSAVLEQSGRQGLDLNAAAQDHRELLEIIKSGDHDAARVRVTQHLTDAHERLQEFFRS
jgi:GntR family transcriptional regulator of gluconate operon